MDEREKKFLKEYGFVLSVKFEEKEIEQLMLAKENLGKALRDFEYALNNFPYIQLSAAESSATESEQEK